MRNNLLVAAAVATALSAGVAQADQPTIAQVQAAATAGTLKNVFMGGSSAAKNGVKAFVQANYCGGSLTTFSSASPVSNPDFNAWACTANIPGVITNTLTVFHYRAEGGSFTGVYPIINNTVTVNTLDLSAANTTCAGAAPTYNCPVAGTSLTNGPNDSWGPAGVTKNKLDLGISDLEPDAFVGQNGPYFAGPPSGYAAGTFGPAQTQAALKALPHTTLFQQTFGVIVFSGTGGLPANVALSRQAVANVLNGNYTDWGNVPAFNAAGAGAPGATVIGAGHPVVLCNRERGSGTRTATDIFFLGDHCVPGASAIKETALAGTFSDNYATSNDIVCVGGNGAANFTAPHVPPAGAIAIGYASVDNNTVAKLGPNVSFVQIDGIAPTNYNTAIGAYGFAFEASGQVNAASGNATGIAAANAIVTALQNINTAPQSAQINTIPGQPAANTASIPLQANGVIFTTDFDRGGGGGNSCNALGEAN
jgi:hypothetical protein